MPMQSTVSGIYPLEDANPGAVFHGNSSAVSWGAVLAGAAAAAALSLLLLILGIGLGLSAVSPWSYNTATMGKSTILWLAFSQLAAAGIGGYLAGRLRVKWVSAHTDEVYFRDTAHGLLAWAVATLVTAIFLAGAVRAVASGAIDTLSAAGTATAAAVGASASSNTSDGGAGPVGYFSDMLLRSEQTTPAPYNAAARAEIGKIFTNGVHAGAGTLAADDQQYLVRQVARSTGLSQSDASKRVNDVYARMIKAKADAEATAKAAAEKARKVAAQSALWMFVALLLGAFISSLMATFGGRQRDDMRGIRGR